MMICAYFLASAQSEEIFLLNPGFEYSFQRKHYNDTAFLGWHDCGSIKFPLESPPDVHPHPAVLFGVTRGPYSGKTYLGLVTRFNHSWESISQVLPTPLQKDSCYRMSIYACRSPVYKSHTIRSNYQLEDFTQPIVLSVWGGDEQCQRKQLLWHSTPVTSHAWMKYEFIIHPDEKVLHLTLEAFYSDLSNGAYNGHVMIDEISSIQPIKCEE